MAVLKYLDTILHVIIDEHINCSNSLQDFMDKSKLSNIQYQGVLELAKYDRYLLIGQKNG